MKTLDQRLTQQKLENAGINAKQAINNMKDSQQKFSEQSITHNYLESGGEPSCVISQIVFDNPLAKKGFELMFCLKPYEQLDAIEITNTGIRAHISKLSK